MAVRHRSLLPREHGAYFQLGVPLATAAIVRPPGLASAGIVAASVLAFLAHEPLLVLLGTRGQRVLAACGDRARGRFAWLAIGAIVAGAAGLALAPAAIVAVAAPVAIMAALVVGLAARRAEHTLAGELAAAVALTGASAVALVAGGASIATAAGAWLGWSVGFGATVLAVHRVLARHKRAAGPIDRVMTVGLVAASAVAIAFAFRCAAATIAAPLLTLAGVVTLAPPPARHLRAVGVVIAIVAAGSAVLAIIGA